MNLFTRSDRAARAAAVLAAIGFAGIAVFQVALAAGAPWGRGMARPTRRVEVRVSRLGNEDSHEVWTYTGMVGTASVSRLLEIAREQLSANPAVLRGDTDFYQQLGAENRRLSEAWTAYYAGEGPQPTGKLP